MIKEIRNNRTMEITYLNDDVLTAHVCCIYHEAKKELQIVDLFATKEYGNCYFEDMLLDEVFLYAATVGASSIKTYIGPEPYNPEPYRTQQQELKWYQDYGFQQESTVCGVTPCLTFRTTPYL